VVAEIKGGGFHFGNHQHADAGSLQIYYRGLQVAKLPQYVFYGTPYDVNFAKRSIAQSMVRVVDPAEKILRNHANDGGSRFIQSHPRTPKQAKTDPTFDYGRVLSCSFGPDARDPEFSYFAADLRAAYTEKLTGYVRRFCFSTCTAPTIPPR
jgi:heparin/heparan-sulfate lyase